VKSTPAAGTLCAFEERAGLESLSFQPPHHAHEHNAGGVHPRQRVLHCRQVRLNGHLE
jgi:hypothetical protein